MDRKNTGGMKKRKTDKRTLVVRVVAIAIAALMVGSAFAVIFTSQI